MKMFWYKYPNEQEFVHFFMICYRKLTILFHLCIDEHRYIEYPLYVDKGRYKMENMEANGYRHGEKNLGSKLEKLAKVEEHCAKKDNMLSKVPIMLILIKIANKTSHWFKQADSDPSKSKIDVAAAKI